MNLLTLLLSPKKVLDEFDKGVRSWINLRERSKLLRGESSGERKCR